MIHQKIPLQRSLPAFVRTRILDEIKKRGYALPCHLVAVNGTLVTVDFDVSGVNLPQATIPIFGSQYQRQPYQVGNPGFTVALAVDISANAGLGTGLPALDQVPANLSSLYWLPGSNTDFPAVSDPSAHLITGPNGVVLEDLQGLAVLKVHPVNGISMTFGGKTVTLTAAGLTIDGILWDTHGHSPGTYNIAGTPVTGEAGPPEAGPA
jgi:hypothetical protein